MPPALHGRVGTGVSQSILDGRGQPCSLAERIADALPWRWILEVPGVADQHPSRTGGLAKVPMPIGQYPDWTEASPVCDYVSKFRPCPQTGSEVGVTIGMELGLLRHINPDRGHVEITVGRAGEKPQRTPSTNPHTPFPIAHILEIRPGEHLSRRCDVILVSSD